MKIASAAVEMGSTHFSLRQQETQESLRFWIGDRRPDFEGRGVGQTPPPAIAPAATLVSLSDAGKAAQSGEAQAIKDTDDAVAKDPKLALIKTVVEYFLGRKIKLFNPQALQANAGADLPLPEESSASTQAGQATPQRAGYGIEYDYHQSISETEQTSFSASGLVRTSDGQEIKFDLSLDMSRSYHEETNVSIRAGDAVKKDPLVINFGGTAAQLTDQRFSFDLDADGKADSINFVTGGSGFLALDKNSDGKINNGSELFGPTSGNGFDELATYDQDHNGWIDANDAVYDQLRILTRNAAGEDQLASLAERQVGALYLGKISTPFDIKDGQNKLQASVLASSVFLNENGEAGTVQQLDLTA